MSKELKYFLLGTLSCFVAICAARHWLPGYAVAAEPPENTRPKLLVNNIQTVDELNIRDKTGKIRIRLRSSPGGPFLAFFGENGHTTLLLDGTAKARSSIRLYDNKDAELVSLSASSSGSGILLRGTKGKIRCGIAVAAGGSATVAAMSADQKWVSSLTADNAKGAIVIAKNDKSGCGVSLASSFATPKLNIYDSKGVYRGGLVALPGSQAGLIIMDKTGKTVKQSMLAE